MQGQAYTYDVNGNLTDNGEYTFIYNDDNRLVEVKDATSITIATYTYDHQGRRISKTTSSGTTYYHYDGDSIRLLYETDESHNIIAEYTWDENGQPLTVTKNGVTYHYHVNGHGDITALTDADGNIVAEYEYDAWGNVLSQTGSMASQNPLRYAGYYYDEEAGLYYLMARYYDAEIGRFISRDSFHGTEDDPQSLNNYVYVKNNPIKFIDPSGHIPFWVIASASYEIGKALFWYYWDLKKGQKFRWRDLFWTIKTATVNGIIAHYLKFRIIGNVIWSVYSDVKWLVLKWTWDPPKSKRRAIRELSITTTRAIISGFF